MIDCDYCGDPVPIDEIRIIPDQRTVCKRCAELYKTAAVRVVERYVHMMAETEDVFEGLYHEWSGGGQQ